MDARRVAERLGLDDSYADWLSALNDVKRAESTLSLPTKSNLRTVLGRVQVPDADIEEIVRAAPTAESAPGFWWLLERVHPVFVGDSQLAVPMPQLPYALGPTARYFYVYVVISAIRKTLIVNSARGIDERITWHTFTDLGEKVEVHRRMHGVGGMDRQYWLILHCRGDLHRLGRLQFEVRTTKQDVHPDPPFAVGAPAIGVHIPQWGGPLDPQACDASFAQMRAFFAHHYPDHPAKVVMCSSWLLDPQLVSCLPPTSNIVRFQRRFELLPLPEDAGDADAAVLDFVFRRRTGADLDRLPQDTTLQRAIVAHLRSGRHWYAPTGWLAI